MAPVGRQVWGLLRQASAALLACAAMSAAIAQGQAPPQSAPTSGAPTPLPPLSEQQASTAVQVVDIQIQGNRTHSREKVLNAMTIRIGQPFDQAAFEKDIKKLTSRSWFVHVVPRKEFVSAGVIITLEVIERPVLEYVRYFGNTVKDKNLNKETALKKGDAFDPYAVREAARKIEAYYEAKGFSGVTVEIAEGDKPGDRGAVFLINEGKKVKFSSITFEGNSREIAPDGRLKKVIQSRKPILWLFKGEVDHQTLEEDSARLLEYYRSLGFFKATVGRKLDYNRDENKLGVTFHIYEGPRYNVRNISFMGNRLFPSEVLMPTLKLNSGEPFDQSVLNKDIGTIKDLYGSNGYVFAEAVGELRFDLEPGVVDIIYSMQEGQQCRVGDIRVTIKGDNPHTKQSTILNRLDFRPGDIADIRKFRNSERRVQASGLFNVDPSKGDVPRLTFSPPDGMENIAGGDKGARGTGRTASRGGVRGQSPDGASAAPRQAVPGSVNTVPGTINAAPGITVPGAANPVPGSVNGNPRYVLGTPINTQQQAYRPQSSAPQTAVPQQRYPQQSAVQQRATQSSDPLRQAAANPQTIRQQSPNGYGGTAVYPVSPNPQPYVQPPSPYAQQPVGGSPYQQTPAAPYQQAAAPTYPQTANPQAQYGAPAASQAVGYNAYGTPGYTGATVGTPPTGSAVTPVQYGEQLPDPRENFSTPRDLGSPPLVTPPPGSFMNPEYVPPPQPALPIDIVASEAQTGRFMLGAGINSNAGVVGSIVLDEQNFDWRRFPTSWEEIRSGRAWRGAGQKFRIEAAPGTQVQRYLFNFSEPFLFDTPVSLGLSGYYFNRYYSDWMEQRLGGRVTFGYQFTPDFSGNIGFRAEDVLIDPSNDNAAEVPSIREATGHSQLYSVRSSLAHDTRDSTFLPTEGHYVVGTFEYFGGSFVYPQFTLNAQKHWLLRERPDGTGRHTFSYYNQLGFSGDNTPVYERFFAGGFSTLRGFYFRGASPTEASDLDPNDYSIVGGNFQWINSLEYMFPITADDALKGVVFVDFGTVEPNTSINWSDYRIAPGAGLRVTIPAISAAPIAIDIAAPVQRMSGPGGDMIQNISFFVGMGR